MTDHTDTHGHGHTDPAMRHRMVVFGRDTAFMSHLSMFSMPEHAYQVILETELTGAGGDPQQTYRDDRDNHPDVAFYTFDPKPFVLTDILPTPDHAAAATTFGGDLFRHHVEKRDPPPVKIAAGVTVNIKNVVHGRRFDVDAPTLKKLQYILFGRGEEVFLAHLITRSPDFDQLIQVTVTPALPADELSRGLLVTVDSRKNTKGERIQASGQASVAATVQTGSGTVNVKIDPIAEVYLNDDSDMSEPPPGA
jgi:hypothetical protein